MPYADPQRQREASQRHYQMNPAEYNKSRARCRAAAIDLKQSIVRSSQGRWISPTEIRELCRTHPCKPTDAQVWRMFHRITQGIPGSAVGGVFLGASPFAPQPQFGFKRERPQDEWARQEFLRRLPAALKRRAHQPKVELLILELTIRSIAVYGH
jgi:hypothetical protein